MPIPMSAVASSGSAAASPQTPTGLPASVPAWAVIAISWSTAGCQGSVRWARSVAIRSAAIAYWVRSLVPMERKSTTSSIRCASSAALGISTITPALRPRARTFAEKSAASATVATIGAITQVSVPVRSAAAAMPSSWRSISPGLSKLQPQPADAEGGVLLALVGRERDRLVGAGVEGADDDVAAVGVGREDRAVDVAPAPRRSARPCWSRKHSSVRNRPDSLRRARLPRTAAEAPSATLASSLTGIPSDGRGGAGPAGELLAQATALLDARAGLLGIGALLDGAGLAVDDDEGPRPRASMMPAAPTTHGMPSWRAMIAVWLVAPPRSVTRAVTSSGSRPDVSLGARSSATRIDGSLRRRHARGGLADEVGDDAALDVAQVGDALGHQAAHVGEDRDELLDRALHRGDRALPGLQVLGDRPSAGPCRGPGRRSR